MISSSLLDVRGASELLCNEVLPNRSCNKWVQSAEPALLCCVLCININSKVRSCERLSEWLNYGSQGNVSTGDTTLVLKGYVKSYQ